MSTLPDEQRHLSILYRMHVMRVIRTAWFFFLQVIMLRSWYWECCRALGDPTRQDPILLNASLSGSEDVGSDSASGEPFDLSDHPMTVHRAVGGTLLGGVCLAIVYIAYREIRDGRISGMMVFGIVVGLLGVLLASWLLRPFRLSSAMVYPGRLEIFSVLGSRVYLASKDRVCVYAWPPTHLYASTTVIVLGETDGKRAIVFTDHDHAARFLRMWAMRTDNGLRDLQTEPRA
ncbi:MAG: hypothetical protein R3B57_00510 [Phycisphaerales bacterium]